MPFSHLPPTARLWVYAAARPLTDDEETTLARRLTDFLDGWASHGRPVEGAAEVRDGRFVLLAAHLPGQPGADVSGCGIDASVQVLEAFADEVGLQWQAGLRVFYRDAGGTVHSASRPAFEALADEGTVHAATPVFDLSVESVAALREGRFERPAGASWHAEAFPLAPAPATAAS
jgi:hypothetical protein